MIPFVIVVFALFCPVTVSVKHTFTIFNTETSGVTDFPEFVGYLLVDEVQVAYYDSIVRMIGPKEEWAKNFLKNKPQHLDYCVHEYETQSQFLRDMIDHLMKSSDNIEGVHVLQQIHGCEWDDQTGEVRGFNQFAYDGEDFIELDLETLTWKASKQQASIFKQRWDTNKTMLDSNKYYHLQVFPDWLRKCLDSAAGSPQRRDLPSVSLLQKTPSSPVSCHATGFYPNRVDLFWRKDGEELHEDVDKGEILPNHDGTFQMSVDLKISSIAPEDWKKYDCVFQLSGVKDDKKEILDKSVIRTNEGKTGIKNDEGNSLAMIIPIVAAAVLVVIAVIGFVVYKKKKDKRPPSPADNREVQQQMLPQP